MQEERRAVWRRAVTGAGIAVAVIILGVAILARGGGGAGRAEAVWQEALERQMEISKQVHEQNKQIAATARELVAADAAARKELITLQQKVQEERTALVRMHEALDTERREIATQRIREPMIAAAIQEAAFLLAVSISLVFCWVLLYRMTADSDEALVRDLLLKDLTSRKPTIVRPATPPQLTHHRPRAIAGKKA